MAQQKDHLLELIEAYATAKATGNQTLVALSAHALQSLLASVEIVERAEKQPAEDFTTPTDVSPVKQSRGRNA